MLLEGVKGHAAPMGMRCPAGWESGMAGASCCCARLSIRSRVGQLQMTHGLTDAESTAQSKEFGERADVVLVERVVRLKIRHFTRAIAGVTQQRSGPVAGGSARWPVAPHTVHG